MNKKSEGNDFYRHSNYDYKNSVIIEVAMTKGDNDGGIC